MRASIITTNKNNTLEKDKNDHLESDIKDLVKNIGDRKNIFHHIQILQSKECNPFPNERRNLKIFRENSICSADSIHKLSGFVCNDCLKRYDTDYRKHFYRC